jgi:hypothetical protein
MKNNKYYYYDIDYKCWLPTKTGWDMICLPKTSPKILLFKDKLRRLYFIFINKFGGA